MSASADLAVVGARVRTLDPARPRAQAVAMRDGVVLAVGTEGEVREHCDARTEVVDLGGAAVVPGIVDGHLHPFFSATLARGLDCSTCATPDALRAALHGERERLGPDAVVRAWGLEYALFAGRGLRGDVLEELAGGPALVTLMDLHTYVATPSVLALAGVDGPVAFPDRSEVVVEDGVPTGELREFGAFDRVADALPELDPDAQRREVLATLARLNAQGVCGAHVMDGTPATFALLRELEARGELTLRLVVPLWLKPEMDDDELAALAALRDERGELWRGGVAKLFLDGVIETGTAWLEEPDSEGGGGEAFWPDPARYRDVVRRFSQAGFTCTTHAIGDRAVRYTLDTYREAGAPAGRHHRLEHAEVLPDDQVGRFAAEGVIASMQPLHMQWREHDASDPWAQRLGPVRTARAFRTRDVLAAGATLVLGSDWPVASHDPRYGMAWARLRREPGRPDLPVLEPDQRLTAEETLAGYTTATARAVGEESLGGRLAPGLRADLTAFAEDPVEVDADDLPALPVRLTVVAGRVVHRADRDA